MNKIENVVLAQEQDDTAPPHLDVLSVSAVGNMAYLEIGKYEESYEERKFKVKNYVSVPLDQLIDILRLLQRAEGKADDD